MFFHNPFISCIQTFYSNSFVFFIFHFFHFFLRILFRYDRIGRNFDSVPNNVLFTYLDAMRFQKDLEKYIEQTAFF